MSAILAHINYFEQGQSLTDACRKAREIGVDGIEFRRRPAQFGGSDLEYLDEVSLALDKYPLEWVSFGGPGVDLMGPNDAHRESEIKSAENFYRTAATRFPLRVVNAFAGSLTNPDENASEWHQSGSAIATDSQWDAAIKGFQYLGTVAEELKFRFAFETHGYYLHDTIESTLRLVNGIGSPHVGVLWDHVNLMLFPSVPTFDEVIRTAGRHLFYIHLKNLLVPPACFVSMSSLSGGVVNIRDQLSQLWSSGYIGPLCLESPRAGDREQFLKEDVEYLRGLIKCFSLAGHDSFQTTGTPS